MTVKYPIPEARLISKFRGHGDARLASRRDSTGTAPGNVWVIEYEDQTIFDTRLASSGKGKFSKRIAETYIVS